MDSLTERLKNSLGKNKFLSHDLYWEIIDQEIVAWKKERSEWLKYELFANNTMRQLDNTRIFQAFELEISEPELVEDTGVCGQPRYEGECHHIKPCPVHDKKVEISDSAWKINQDIHKSSKPQKKPREIILDYRFQIARENQIENISDGFVMAAAIIKFLDERLG